MLRTAIITLLLLSYGGAFAAKTIPPQQSLSTLCKVWGLLKYYHPEIRNAAINWDSTLVSQIPLFNRPISLDSLNVRISELILSRGALKNHVTIRTDIQGIPAFRWIWKSSLLNSKNKQLLIELISSYSKGDNFYATQPDSTFAVSFANDTLYRNQIFPDQPVRLLSLFRAWNAINYFFPYAKHMDTDLDTVLSDLIPQFLDAGDTLLYHLAMKKFAASLNDSHANLSLSRYLLSQYKYRAEASVRFVENQYVFHETSTSVNDGLKKGDVLLKIAGKDVHKFADSITQYFRASNDLVTKSGLTFFLLSGSTENLNIKIRRGTQEKEVVFKRTLTPVYHNNPPAPAMRLLGGGEIAYLNNSPDGDVEFLDSLLRIAVSKKAIIVDLRGSSTFIHYPTYARYLSSDTSDWAQIIMPDNSLPGTFRKRNKNPRTNWNLQNTIQPYDGIVVVLVDEFTQSYLEYFAMFLKQRKNTVTMGTQTAGADGNTARIQLPGNFRLVFTQTEVLWPDGRQTQRIGIVPDVPANYSIKGIEKGEDEILNKAILFIQDRLK